MPIGHTNNPNGAPSKICPEARKRIINAINGNAPYQVAAWKARIAEKTLYNWLNKGKEDLDAGIESEFSLLLQDLKECEADKILAHLDSVEAQTERWQSRMTLLERRWREHFGQDAGVIEELKKTFADILEKMEKKS